MEQGILGPEKRGHTPRFKILDAITKALGICLLELLVESGIASLIVAGKSWQCGMATQPWAELELREQLSRQVHSINLGHS